MLYLDETDVLLGGQQNVLWFQVSVDDPITVEILHMHTYSHTVEVCCYQNNRASVSPEQLSAFDRSKV